MVHFPGQVRQVHSPPNLYSNLGPSRAGYDSNCGRGNSGALGDRAPLNLTPGRYQWDDDIEQAPQDSIREELKARLESSFHMNISRDPKALF